jgi:hypothetical protein
MYKLWQLLKRKHLNLSATRGGLPGGAKRLCKLSGLYLWVSQFSLVAQLALSILKTKKKQQSSFPLDLNENAVFAIVGQGGIFH